MPLDLDGFLPATGAPSGSEFYNANRDTPIDPLVPTLIEDTSDLVRQYLDLNQSYAATAVANANEAINALADWQPPDELPDPPPAPNIIASFSASIGLGFETDPDLGELQPLDVPVFTPEDVTLPNITGDLTLPEFTSLLSGLNIPEPPSLPDVPEPTEPTIDYDMELPVAPTPSYGGPPDLTEIVIPTYVPPTLPVFNDDAPEFDTLPPQPVIQWAEPVYTSTIKDAVEEVLLEMLEGGTGLPEGVELAIWERGRQREDVLALRTIDAATSSLAAKGFPYHTGLLNRQIAVAIEEAARKGTELSREVMIEQARLEQKNREFAVEKGIAYEQVFTAVFLAIVERNFQIAKFGVETQIQIYNLQIAAFNVEQAVYTQKLAKYKTDLEAALFYIKAFEAQVEAEKAKAQVNVALVQSYEAEIRAFGQQVEAYKALVQAAIARADLQKNKVDIFKAQIDAMVAKINGQRSRYDAYEAQVRGESARVGLEEVNARVYTAQVQAYGEKASVLLKRADLDYKSNEQRLQWNIANMQRVTAYNGQRLNAIQAKLAAFQANVSKSVAKFDADSKNKQAELQANIEIGRLAIAKYQALLEQWKTRSVEIVEMAKIVTAAMQGAAQAATTLASGAMAGTHVSAGLSAGANAGQSSTRSSSDTTTQTKSVSENSNYTIVHNYQHRV